MKRAFLLIAALSSAVAGAQAQEQLDKCPSKCADGMTSCVSRCGSNMKCSTNCNARMGDCMARCQPANGEITTGGKDKKCFGADGKKIACGTYKPIAPPKPREDNTVYPNKAAKDLQKDPSFKGAEGLQ